MGEDKIDSVLFLKTLWKYADWSSLNKTIEKIKDKVYLYESGLFVEKGKYEEGEQVVWATDNNGERVFYNYDTNEWEYPNEQEKTIEIGGKKRRVCSKCNKPRIDINGVENCDFCLQSLTSCDLIDFACCGHGDKDQAYISFKDGRRWVLDKEWSR